MYTNLQIDGCACAQLQSSLKVREAGQSQAPLSSPKHERSVHTVPPSYDYLILYNHNSFV